jgi:hypothetical protein
VSPPIHPLTSSQGAVFLINSCQAYFSCGPSCEGQALFRSYGRFFAEFLGDFSPVRLALLELITCVGLRYGSLVVNLRKFSWKRAFMNQSRVAPQPLRFAWRSPCGLLPDLPRSSPYNTNTNPIRCSRYCTPSFLRTTKKSWNINHVSIGSGVRHSLRPD